MKFFKSSLLNSILFFVLGLILLTNKNDIVNYIPYVIGTVLIIIGVVKLHAFIKDRRVSGKGKFTDLLTFPIGVGFGIVALLSNETVLNTMRVILGIWVLYSGINKLISVLRAHKTQPKVFKPILILSFLMIATGIAVICIRDLSFNFLGLFIVIYSVLDLVIYILYAKEGPEKVKDAVVIDVEDAKITNKTEKFEIEKK